MIRILITQHLRTLKKIGPGRELCLTGKVLYKGTEIFVADPEDCFYDEKNVPGLAFLYEGEKLYVLWGDLFQEVSLTCGIAFELTLPVVH